MLLTMGFVAGEVLIPGYGLEGMGLAFILFGFLAVVSYYEGSQLLLQASRAKPLQKIHAPELFHVVEEMAIASGLKPIPQIYLIKSEIPNAFATGRSSETAAIVVTEGLLETCTREELQGVIAHEISHILHRDILYMTLLSMMMASIGQIAQVSRPVGSLGKHQVGNVLGGKIQSALKAGGVGGILMVAGVLLLFLGPLFAKILYFKGSRTREFLADASAVIFTRNPGALADALDRISQKMKQRKWHTLPGVSPALLIVGPALFATHPPTEQRTAILRKLAGEPAIGYTQYSQAYQQVVGKSPQFVPKQMVGKESRERELKKTKQRKVKEEYIEKQMPWVPGYRLKRKGEPEKLQDPYLATTCSCGTTFPIPDDVTSILDLECPSCHQAIYTG